MLVLPAKTLFKYRAMDYKSFAILLWSLVYWSNSLASKGWTLLALCPFHPLWIMLFRVSPNLLPPAKTWSCSQSHLAPEETVIPPHQFPCPRETIAPLSRTLTYCLRPFFWFTLIKETKVKDHVKWRIPLGAQWVVSACLAPAPWSQWHGYGQENHQGAGLTPCSCDGTWPAIVPCLLFTTDMELVFFVQQRLNAAGFLSQETHHHVESNLAAQSKSEDTKNIWLSRMSHLTKSHQNEETDSQRKRLVLVKLRNAEPGLLFATMSDLS